MRRESVEYVGSFQADTFIAEDCYLQVERWELFV
jgi:hypothetical protein